MTLYVHRNLLRFVKDGEMLGGGGAKGGGGEPIFRILKSLAYRTYYYYRRMIDIKVAAILSSLQFETIVRNSHKDSY